MKPTVLMFVVIALITAAAVWTEREAIATAFNRAKAYHTISVTPEGCQ